MRHRVWLLASMALLISQSSAAAVGFRSYELELAAPARQEVATLRLSPEGAKHLAVSGVGDDGTAVLSVFAPLPEGGYAAKPSRTIALPRDVVALDVGSSAEGGLETLYALTPRAVLRWDPATDAFTPVAQTRSMYQTRPMKEMLPVEFLRDADGDGDDDIVLADFDGYRIFFQGPPTEFPQSQLLPLETIAHHDEYNDRVAYKAVPIHFGDMDLDGKIEAAAVRDDSLRIFEIDPASERASATNIPLNIGIGDRIMRDDMGEVDQRNQTWKYLVTMDDFDGDEVPDLLAHKVHSAGVFDKQHTLELHRGSPGKDSVTYPAEPSTRIESALVVDEPIATDIDDDGKLDLAVGSLDFGIGTVLSVLVTGSVDVDVSFYPLTADGSFTAQPSLREEVKIEVDLSSGRPTIPVAQLADVNGDGRKDLVLGGGSENQLRIFLGNGETSLFEGTPSAVEVTLPKNGRLVGVDDVNGDRKEDLLVRYGKLDGKDLDRKLVVMIAQ